MRCNTPTEAADGASTDALPAVATAEAEAAVADAHDTFDVADSEFAVSRVVGSALSLATDSSMVDIAADELVAAFAAKFFADDVALAGVVAVIGVFECDESVLRTCSHT